MIKVTLSQKLAYLGAVKVTGTKEHAGGRSIPVTKGKPHRFDSNNGLWCFYDEAGDPWLIPLNLISSDLVDRIGDEYQLRGGAHVPHSNDSSWFMRTELPKLRECQRTRLLFERLASDTLDTVELAVMEDHLLACQDCGEVWGRLLMEKVGSGELPTLEPPSIPPMDLYDRYLAARKDKPKE